MVALDDQIGRRWTSHSHTLAIIEYVGLVYHVQIGLGSSESSVEMEFVGTFYTW